MHYYASNNVDGRGRCPYTHAWRAFHKRNGQCGCSTWRLLCSPHWWRRTTCIHSFNYYYNFPSIRQICDFVCGIHAVGLPNYRINKKYSYFFFLNENKTGMRRAQSMATSWIPARRNACYNFTWNWRRRTAFLYSLSSIALNATQIIFMLMV